jgi:hypothetical protein
VNVSSRVWPNKAVERAQKKIAAPADADAAIVYQCDL